MKYKHQRKSPIIITPVLGDILKLVEDSKTSARRICQKAGVDEACIFRIRRRESYPRIDSVENIAAALGYKLVLEKI